MKRVVITGAGIVSCIGNDMATVEASLRAGQSGIKAVEKFTELGLRSQVAGVPEIDIEALIDRKQLRFMGDAAAYAQIALEDAITQAGLTPEQVSHPRTGLIMGSGGGSPANQIEAADILRSKGIRRVGPYQVTRCMSSTVSACLSTNFKVKGINYSITSACSTSAHCIGAAAQQIAWGMQDVMFAGGGEELSWGMSLLFDGMGAMSSKYNDTPEKASRAYDANRDGFVIVGRRRCRGAGKPGACPGARRHHPGRGGGLWRHQRRRGHGGPFGRRRHCLHAPGHLHLSEPIDYINTHGTSTPVGDVPELRAIREVFGDKVPPFSSTKSLTGHSLGATGVQEAIYCLIMLRQGFIAGSANVETPDPAAAGRHAPGARDARRAAAHRAVQQLRLWRHQRQPGAAPLGALSRAHWLLLK